MSDLISDQLVEASVTADTEYRITGGADYQFNLNGTATWDFWDGVAFVPYTAGSGKNFIGAAPVSGRVQINVGSGTAVGSFIRRK
tara:strand:+ start:894 stop:1148 length:255 start_codon:yes stop_codon:yes gene_type:complete